MNIDDLKREVHREHLRKCGWTDAEIDEAIAETPDFDKWGYQYGGDLAVEWAIDYLHAKGLLRTEPEGALEHIGNVFFMGQHFIVRRENHASFVKLIEMIGGDKAAPVTPAEDVVEEKLPDTEVLEALNKCWVPKVGGTYELDRKRAWDFVGTHEEFIRNAAAYGAVEAARLQAQSQKEVRALRECVRDLMTVQCMDDHQHMTEGQALLDKHAATIRGCE